MKRPYTLILVLALLTLFFFGCGNDGGFSADPGYDFKLFEESKVEKLIEPIKNEDTNLLSTLLHDKSIDVNYQEKKYGNTLLMLAVQHQLDKSVSVLLSNGADPNIIDFEEKENALHIASSMNNYECNAEMVKLLIHHGANVNSVQKANVDGESVIETPLTIASAENCIETVKVLVENGAEIGQYTYYEGYNAIIVSIIFENLEITKFLLDNWKGDFSNCYYLRSNQADQEEKLSVCDLLKEINVKANPQRVDLLDNLMKQCNCPK